MIRIIPQPKKITEKNGVCGNPDNLSFINDGTLADEAYRINVETDGIKIFASGEKGFFYGRKTVEQLIMLYGEAFPCLEISDEPKYSYRGFMLDCARHMFPVSEIKKLIDTAALLKLNKFHWHLSDDQGFRIELESFPELTERGSVRKCDNFGSMCRSDKEYSGFYTKSEIREIISYCSERFIDVIPEIDMPGHTSAILHVFPELSCRKEPVEVKTRQGIYKDNMCMGNKDTTVFVKKLLDELCELFPYPYFHIGGDEAPDDYRRTCPECQKVIKENGLSCTADLQCFFANDISGYLAEKGRKAIVWNDILKGGGLNKNITVQRWLDPKKHAVTAANEGSKIIVSDFRPYYFDYPYGMYPLKKVYNHNPAGCREFTEAGRKNIIGVEAPVWTEFIDNAERLEYMCLPRWFSFSENAWCEQGAKDYREFKKSAIKLSEKLREKGFNCAPEKDLDMNVFRRLADVIKFFSAFLSNKK